MPKRSALLAGAAWFSSLRVVLTYGGKPGLVLYTFAVATVVWILRIHRIPPALQTAIVAVFAIVAVLTLVVVYPRANVSVPSAGSDADDALNIAGQALVHGRYLYGQQTYLGNPIAPLPGAVLFALPFVLIFGSSAYQALLWWPAFARALARFPEWFPTLVLVFLSVEVWHALATGSDGFINGIYVALLSLAVLDRPTLPRAMLLGVALSSRAIMFPVGPLLVLVIANEDRRTAMRIGLAAIIAFVAVTLPFYVWSPEGFGPIHQGVKLWVSDSGASLAFGIGTVGVSFAAAVVLLQGRRSRFYAAASVALGLPVLVLTAAAIALYGAGGLSYTSYALEALPFVALSSVGGPVREFP
jgi:hypothetical protein